ncbi:MAG: sigma 54-interacting transcriptional regulator [Syntrophomonadaceae bacterium]|nr:sigma 54-interacting transcriptional regulator [Bacillota bacterium]NLM88230.1 sigma 54-interacting transcriptional regulator [Syntrophomonadaceae bacterium]
MFKLSTMPQKYLDVIETIFNEFDGALVIDEKGIIRIITDYYCRESGLSKEKVLGKRVDEVFPHTRMLEVLRSGKPIIADIWELNGKSQIVSRVPITANGKIIGAAGFNIFRYLDDAKGFARRISNMFSELKYYKEEVKRLSSAKYSLASIVGRSDAIMEAKEQVRMVAATSIPVSITGETGTGKELFAHAIHQESSRREYPLVRVNCASIPDNLLESELFGYEEGAFTGARKAGKPGKFELADRGTLFLDEISELSWIAQAGLLRVLQEKELERVGGTQTVAVDVRIISATNRSLRELVSQVKFRKDLFFRLDVFPIHIPPLRERIEDLEPLTEFFINQYNQESGGQIEGITKEAMARLRQYHWPGNVRELNTVIERACIDAGAGKITIDNLLRFTSPKHNGNLRNKYQGFDLAKAREEAEKQTILRAIKACGGNKTQAAQLLGLSRSALYYKMEQYNLSPSPRDSAIS